MTAGSGPFAINVVSSVNIKISLSKPSLKVSGPFAINVVSSANIKISLSKPSAYTHILLSTDTLRF